MDADFKNFALMIPLGAYTEPAPPAPPSKWNKLLCFIVGHQWRNIMVTTTERTLPEKCERCHKQRWLSKPNWRRALIRSVNKFLDMALRPLCYLGVHKWKSTYGFALYHYGRDGELSGVTVREDHYGCVRCKKSKTVKIEP